MSGLETCAIGLQSHSPLAPPATFLKAIVTFTTVLGEKQEKTPFTLELT